MSRVARVVVPGYPHHVTQRGNHACGVADVFETEDDRRAYLRFLKKYGERHGLDIRAYCLMTNGAYENRGSPVCARGLASLGTVPAFGTRGVAGPRVTRRAHGLRHAFQHAHPTERPRVARAFLFVHTGRSAFVGGGPLRRAQPRARGNGGPVRRPPLVQRASPLRGTDPVFREVFEAKHGVCPS